MTASPLAREPLEAGGLSSGVLAGTVLGPVHGDYETQAAKPPPAADVAMGGTVPSDAAPLVADLDPPVPEGDGGMAVEESGVASQARAETGVGT